MTEREHIVMDTARALRVAQVEGLKERMTAMKPIARRVNPFVHRDRMDGWEYAKCAFGIILVPLRLILFMIILLTSSVFLAMSVAFMDDKKPMSKFRRNVFQMPCSWILLRGWMFCFGVWRINIKGTIAPSTSPYQGRVVVVAPHSTFIDGFIMQYVFDIASVVAKKEAAKGLFGLLMKAFQAILVDRQSKSARKGALEAIIERVQSELPWRHLIMFPEGTCTNRKALISFKIGAFAGARPVQPVLLRWDRNVNFDPTWTSGGPSRLWLLFRLLSQISTAVDVEILPVYVPNELEREDPVLFANGVRGVMAQALGIPVTEHSYEDSFLAKYAHQLKLDPQAAFPNEFSVLHNLCQVDYDDARKLLKRFTEVKRSRVKNVNQIMVSEFSSEQISRSSDRITMQEFADLIGLPLTEPVIEFFSLLDVSGEGTIDFPAFLVGLTFVSKSTTFEDAAKIIWDTFDRRQDGKIQVKHLKKVLDMVFLRVDNRTIPLLKGAKSHAYVTYDEFLAMLKAHPEYVPIALEVAATPVGDRGQRKLSVTSAVETLDKKKAALKDAAAKDAEAGSRHKSVTALAPTPMEEKF